MSLFKSKDDRRLERELEIKRGVQKMRKHVRSLEKDEKDLLNKAKRAKQLGDATQLNFIKANLKRTAASHRLMERQILNMETFNQLKDIVPAANGSKANITLKNLSGLTAAQLQELASLAPTLVAFDLTTS